MTSDGTDAPDAARPTYEELVEALTNSQRVLQSMITPPFNVSPLMAFSLATDAEVKARTLLARCRQERSNG